MLLNEFCFQHWRDNEKKNIPGKYKAEMVDLYLWLSEKISYDSSVGHLKRREARQNSLR